MSRKTAITIAAFIVDGRGAITMAGATNNAKVVVIKKTRHHHYD
ncbi:MAG: hypothetical protein WCB78_03290 [Pseudolabrys sp.]